MREFFEGYIAGLEAKRLDVAPPAEQPSRRWGKDFSDGYLAGLRLALKMQVVS